MEKINILGAGLSGLSSAINLVKAGYEVEVFDRNNDTGVRFNGDLQGLENWSSKTDVLQSLKEMNIEINFSNHPFSEVYLSNCKETEKITFKKPLFYLVKRGVEKDTIDYGLKTQAQKLGVKINYNSSLPPEQAQIIATGPNPKKIAAVAQGIVFNTKLSNIAVALINDQAAYFGYSYLLVIDGYGCICSVVFKKLEEITNCFEATKDYFTKSYDLDIQNPKKVGGVGTFASNPVFQKDDSFYVGEAAGIQDFLAGFGMRTAITSGYLAARAIIENKDYEKLAKRKFSKYLKAGVVNRYVWEKIDIDNYLTAIETVKKVEDPFDFLRSIYNFGFIEKIEYPIAHQYMKKNYPNLDI